MYSKVTAVFSVIKIYHVKIASFQKMTCLYIEFGHSVLSAINY